MENSQVALAQEKEVDEELLTKEIETSKKIQVQIKDAIEKIGNEGRYQIILIVYLILCFIFATFLLVGTSYFYMNPNFTCDGISTSEEDACKQLSTCTIQNDYTITAYTKLYCDDKKVLRELIQSMLGIGACLGVLFVNFVSDLKGRKFSFIFSLLSGILATLLLIIGAYSQTQGIFVISQILAGFCGNSILTLVYVMSDRLMSKKFSNYCILITNGFFGLAQISLIGFTGALNWEHLSLLVMLIPSIGLVIVAHFLLIEDPMFLFTKSRIEQCNKSLQQIAIINKTQDKLAESFGVVKKLEKEHIQMHYDSKPALQAVGSASKLKYLHLLKKKEIFIPIIFIGVYNLAGNLIYYVLSFAISNIGSSFNLNIALFGSVEFLGVFPLMFVGDRTPRKLGFIVITVLHIVASIFFIFDLSGIVATILIVFIRFIFTSSYMLYIFFVVETFPQHIQSTCFGIVEFVSQLGKFFAPFMIGLASAIGISPILLTGFISVFVGVAIIPSLKETLVKKSKVDQLKESLLEAEGTAQ